MKKFICLLILLTITGCAGRASTIPPVAVNSLEYRSLGCGDTKALLSQKREEENAMTRRQNNAALGDAVGVVLVLLPLGSVFGADVSGELAQVKGEVNALERAIAVNCAPVQTNAF
jgi:hypothetical protein